MEYIITIITSYTLLRILDNITILHWMVEE